MLCSYETVKYVHIKDARLGVLRYCFIVCIVIYVVVFEMLAMGGWLESTPVTGVVRFSLQQPTINNCNPSEGNCLNNFLPLHKIPYCEQYHKSDHLNKNSDHDPKRMNAYRNDNNVVSSGYAGNIYPCEIYEAMNAQIISESSLAVITRASTLSQELVCGSDMNNSDSNDLTCPRTYNNTSEENKFYIAQSEAFTILFDHAVTASKICSSKGKKHYACSAMASEYQGRLYSVNDDLCKEEHNKNKNAFQNFRGTKKTDTAPCYITPNMTATHSQDFFTLDVLLRAAGVNLDDCTRSSNTTSNSATITASKSDNHLHIDNNGKGGSLSSSSCETYRDTGGTMLLNIYWSDFNAYDGLVTPYYYYSPQFIEGSNFKQEIPYYEQYRERRTVFNAHGIKVAVLLGGEFNQFNLLTFMITLTTAVGLLAVATTVVDFLMLYILPEKERYQDAKYEESEQIFNNIGENMSLLPMPLLNGTLRNRFTIPYLRSNSDNNFEQNNNLDGRQTSNAINENRGCISQDGGTDGFNQRGSYDDDSAGISLANAPLVEQIHSQHDENHQQSQRTAAAIIPVEANGNRGEGDLNEPLLLN